MKQSHRYVLMVVPVLGFAVGGFAVGRYTAPVAEEASVIEIEAPVATNNNRDQTAKIDLLGKKLADAETKIKELNAEIDSILGKDLPQAVPVAAGEDENGRTPGPRSREDREAEMERLKTEDPERYAAMVKEREDREKRHQEFQERRRESEAKRDDYFANVNIAYMSQDEQKALATFVSEYQELRSLMEQRDNQNEADRAKAWQLGMNVMRQSNDIRNSLLKATAKEMGFNDAESVEFSESINQIFGATSLMGPGGFPGRGGNRGGGNRGR